MSDALERIKNRQRPAVPKRDPVITSTADRSIDSSTLDIEVSTTPDIQISRLSNENVAILALDEISLPVKQTTLRLEKGLSDDLQALCQREQICREVLIEAMFLNLLNAPESREDIVAQARERQRKRTAIANHKRALSMVQRVSNQP